MKLAYHFDAFLDTIAGNYAYHYEDALLKAILSDDRHLVSSKVFIGDLLIHRLGREYKEVPGGHMEVFDHDRFKRLVERWLVDGGDGYSKFSEELFSAVMEGEIFTVCFESVDAATGVYLHESLSEMPGYLGVMQVNDESPVHWYLYSQSLLPRYRIIGQRSYVFYHSFDPESKDEGRLARHRSLGFRSVEFEDLNGKFTIFDEYDDFRHARRVAEWKRRGGSLLGFVADDVVSRLSDSAPKLGDKIWAALKAFEEAETAEQYAQVMASCRRIVEYATDAIFPPTNEVRDDRKLGGQQYRNRLLAFADDQHKSDTNIELVAVSTNALREQVEKLSALANKGVHGEVIRPEARRCLLRTILLLDDIISLKSTPFTIKDHLNFDGMIEFLRRSESESPEA